jgi:hypothetical protein
MAKLPGQKLDKEMKMMIHMPEPLTQSRLGVLQRIVRDKFCWSVESSYIYLSSIDKNPHELFLMIYPADPTFVPLK